MHSGFVIEFVTFEYRVESVDLAAWFWLEQKRRYAVLAGITRSKERVRTSREFQEARLTEQPYIEYNSPPFISLCIDINLIFLNLY